MNPDPMCVCCTWHRINTHVNITWSVCNTSGSDLSPMGEKHGGKTWRYREGEETEAWRALRRGERRRKLWGIGKGVKRRRI